MKPTFFIDPDKEDDLVGQALEIFRRDGDVWAGKLVGELGISYDCAEHLLEQLAGRGLIKQPCGKPLKTVAPKPATKARRRGKRSSGVAENNAGGVIALLFILAVIFVAMLLACAR